VGRYQNTCTLCKLDVIDEIGGMVQVGKLEERVREGCEEWASSLSLSDSGPSARIPDEKKVREGTIVDQGFNAQTEVNLVNMWNATPQCAMKRFRLRSRKWCSGTP